MYIYIYVYIYCGKHKKENNKKEEVYVERQRDRETERQRDRETERQRDRETERQRDRETERQRDRETKAEHIFDSVRHSVACMLEGQVFWHSERGGGGDLELLSSMGKLQTVDVPSSHSQKILKTMVA